MEAMNDPLLSVQAAVLHLGLGEYDLALNSLQTACDRRAVPGIHWLKIEPIWDILRNEPRFAELFESYAPCRLNTPVHRGQSV